MPQHSNSNMRACVCECVWETESAIYATVLITTHVSFTRSIAIFWSFYYPGRGAQYNKTAPTTTPEYIQTHPLYTRILCALYCCMFWMCCTPLLSRPLSFSVSPLYSHIWTAFGIYNRVQSRPCNALSNPVHIIHTYIEVYYVYTDIKIYSIRMQLLSNMCRLLSFYTLLPLFLVHRCGSWQVCMCAYTRSYT